jgi:hypothetical protein
MFVSELVNILEINGVKISAYIIKSRHLFSSQNTARSWFSHCLSAKP